MSKKQKVKGKPDIRAMVNHLNALRIERTRVIGDMFSLPDSSESYQALQKRLDDLNERIAEIIKTLKRLGAQV